MATKISWADESWNPIVGCSKISAGCLNCYAEKMARRQVAMGTPGYYSVMDGKKWNGKTVLVNKKLAIPLHWRKPRKIFVCSMSDLFHESVPFEWIDRVMDIIEQCPQHLFYLLTKRSAEMRDYVSTYGGDGGPLPPNVHLGVTVENQDNVGRIADLVQTPAAKRFVSFEPLLEDMPYIPDLEQVDYMFAGCESGPEQRLCSLNAIRYLMSDCRDAKVKIHVKQIPLNGKCNKKIAEWPEEFRVRKI
jgi:protein gp37